jgi:Zn-finger protein
MTLFAKQVQWAKSKHGIADALYDRTSCAVCHSHQGFLERVATGEWETAATVTDVVGINCRTCHQIHSTYTAADLAYTTPDEVAFRVADVTVDLGGSNNLCATCHQSRLRSPMPVIDGDDVTFTSTHYGPHHGPQGDIMAGVGFFMFDDTPGGTHAHGEEGGGCGTCHMAAASENNGGHTWNLEGDYVVGCNTCHSGVEDFGHFGLQADVEALLVELGHLLETAGIAHYDDVDEEWHPVPGTYSANVTAAFWNFIGVIEDRSLGLHNPRYVKGLLESSIAEIQ